jgi:hypothetical protein
LVRDVQSHSDKNLISTPSLAPLVRPAGHSFLPAGRDLQSSGIPGASFQFGRTSIVLAAALAAFGAMPE